MARISGIILDETHSSPHRQANEAPGPLTIIRPVRGIGSLQLDELIERYDVAMLLMWRDVKARYKQTALGWVWGLAQPLVTVIVMTLVFGHVVKLPSEGVPYALFAFSGFLPWQFFASATNRAAASMTANTQLLKKVYVPRLSIPLSGVLSAVVDIMFAGLILVVLMIWHGVPLTWRILWTPLIMASAGALAWGLGSVLAVLNCRFRDVGQALPLGLQLWMYMTPVIYPLVVAPEWLRPILVCNPMTGLIVAFRWAVCGTPMDETALAASAIVSGTVLLVGGALFARLERRMVDYL